MNLGDVLSDAANYTSKLTRRLGDLIILIILNIIPIANIVVVGYAARIIEEGAEEPPKLEKYLELFVKGLKVLFVAALYSIIPMLVVFLGLGLTSVKGLGPLSLAVTGIGMLFLAVGLVFLFVFMVVGAMGIAHMLRTGRIAAAFDIPEVFSLIKSYGVLGYIAWLLVIFVLGLVVAGLASVFYPLGAIAGVFLQVFAARSLYLIYTEASKA